jgi:rapamycin-insensitive companion of mTOR
MFFARLKQQYPLVFQDVCLYSEVSHRMGSATYRLSARRFLQELFLDLQFDAVSTVFKQGDIFSFLKCVFT